MKSWQGPLQHHCVHKQHSCLQRNVAAMKSRWQRCVRFDQANLNLRPPTPETNALPLDQLAVREHNQKYRLNVSEHKAQVEFLKNCKYYRSTLWFEKYDTLKS